MAKSIMIQGTMSNVGKSALAAGLCRVLKQDGYKVAPFKSQNMALNSFITKEGLEMGRAQVMQAEAAGIEPEAIMNPILLKPTNDTGSQVIINGKPIGVMAAREYYRHKKEYIPAIMDAYHELKKKYDIIVIEGAGSPAEINLKKDDIVNMGMAKLVDAPVLLVGDIDRGGVFAQLVGTIMLLEEEERRRVKGLVMNKFRGDKRILEPGIKQLYDICPIPVAGVIPYVKLDIDDEDSLASRIEPSVYNAHMSDEQFDIVVIRVPHISNFTDFNALERIEEVNLRYADKAEQIGNPDLIILPGSKNTINDLKWLRKNGMEAQIIKCSRQDIPVFGICGGFQMLGNVIDDSCGAETGEVVAGMGLLPVTTTFSKNKHRTRVQGITCIQSGMWEMLGQKECKGYEIHMGESTISEDGANPFARIFNTVDKTEYMDGCVRGNTAGTYMHGIFDGQEFCDSLINMLCARYGITSKSGVRISFDEYKQREYDKLADVIRENMDMKYIYEIIG